MLEKQRKTAKKSKEKNWEIRNLQQKQWKMEEASSKLIKISKTPNSKPVNNRNSRNSRQQTAKGKNSSKTAK